MAQYRASEEKRKYCAAQVADRAQRPSVAWCYNNLHYDDCDGCVASGTAWCCSTSSTVPSWAHLDSQSHIEIAQLSAPQRGPLWQPRPWVHYPELYAGHEPDVPEFVVVVLLAFAAQPQAHTGSSCHPKPNQGSHAGRIQPVARQRRDLRMGKPSCWLLARVQEFKIPTAMVVRTPSQNARFGHSPDAGTRPPSGLDDSLV